MTELEAAQAIAEGSLPSPYQLGGMTLFAVRVTGTGMAYRDSLDEYVWRDPELYLNDEFLARVSGLPLVWVHPEKGSLNSEEFENRVIGAMMFGYIQGEDVWGIARVYDKDAIRLMTEGQLSTSPGVVFKPGDGNVSKEHEGKKFLIEGKPSILDHLAVCEQGVWDKGGDPVGVLNETLTQETHGVAEDKKEDSARHDAEAARDAKMDKIMDAVGGMMDSFQRMDKRLDAMEKGAADAKMDALRKDKFGKRKDGESFADWGKRHDEDERSMADALRKDGKSEEDCVKDAKGFRKDAEESEKRADKDFDKWAEEEKKEPEHKEDKKKDAEGAEDKKEEAKEEKAEKEEEGKTDAKMDAAAKENSELRAQLAELTKAVKHLTVETTAEDRDLLATAQSRADAVAGMFGTRVDAPMMGETPLAYRKRLLGRFKKHSARFKDEKFDFHNGATLTAVEDIIYNDAMTAARSPDEETTIGRLIPLQERDAAGRLITKFAGDPMAWMAPFMAGGRRGSIFNPNQRRN